jgi:hypothetical protein
MSSILTASDENANRLMELFQELLNTLPQGAATLGSRQTKDGDGTIVWLKPTNKRALLNSALTLIMATTPLST